MAWVLDASVTLTWCFTDEATKETDALLDLLTQDQAVVPPLWYLEVTNVLVLAERQGKISEADLLTFTSDLKALPIEFDRGNAMDLLGPTLALARQHSLTSYDAAYVELAARHGLPVATLDRSVRRAAKEMGIRLLLS